MIKFYKSFVGKLLLTLLYMKDQLEDIDGEDIRQNALDNWYREGGRGSGSNLGNAVEYIIDNDDAGAHGIEFDEMLQELAAKLGNHGENTDSDLVDTIVNVLKLPYAQNSLSGKSLETLKKAILLPEELAGLKSRLAKVELACANCGRDLFVEEMVTLGVTGYSSNSNKGAFYCIACSKPTTIGCVHGCSGHVDLNPKFRKSLEKLQKCGICVAEEESREFRGQPSPSVVSPVAVDIGADVGRVELENGPSISFHSTGSVPTPVLINPTMRYISTWQEAPATPSPAGRYIQSMPPPFPSAAQPSISRTLREMTNRQMAGLGTPVAAPDSYRPYVTNSISTGNPIDPPAEVEEDSLVPVYEDLDNDDFNDDFCEDDEDLRDED